MRIIEGLLVLSRSESASDREPMDVAAIARERVEHWRPLAQELGVQLTFEGATTARGLAVATAVEQVIDNYVDNALSVSPWGSDLLVRVVAEEHRVIIAVLDSGPGLSAEDRERAFSRFWRARTDNGGSGLGLAIVQQLVTASGGEVRLEARPGGGLAAIAMFDNA